MQTFKEFFLTEFGSGTVGLTNWGFAHNRPRAFSQHSPPSTHTNEPEHLIPMIIQWRMQLLSYIIHLHEAHALLEANGKEWLLEGLIGHWHPKALDYLAKSGVVSPQTQKVQTTIQDLEHHQLLNYAGVHSRGQDPQTGAELFVLPNKQIVALGEEPVPVEVEAHEVSTQAAVGQFEKQKMFNRVGQGVKNAGAAIWQHATQGQLQADPSTTMYH